MTHRYALAAVMLAAFALPAAAQQTTTADTSKRRPRPTTSTARSPTPPTPTTEVAPVTAQFRPSVTTP